MIVSTCLGALEGPVRRAMGVLGRDRVLERILARDFSVWKDEDRGITDRLGWLDPLPGAFEALSGIGTFVEGVLRDGLARILLLGMGGSSLAPGVFGRVFRTRPGFPRLDVLDTTSPDAVARIDRGLDIERTLFLVSSKSGTTAETSALFNHFFRMTADALGKKRVGRHFAAITDPGTPLESLARRHSFRHVFSGAPDVGGRFSALTVFGLVPAALKGIDIRGMLTASTDLIRACREADPETNPAALLGTALGVLAGRGIDKATFFVSPRLWSLAAWLEQLIAESTGKEGRGILPVPESAPARRLAYGKGRAFLFVDLGADAALDRRAHALGKNGFPTISVSVGDISTLPGHFFLWEMATAVAGAILGVNPFDQPNVEATKKRTREALEAPEPKPGLASDAEGSADRCREDLFRFLSRARKGDYVALQAFLDPSPGNERALGELQHALHDRTGLPVTSGFGPRYLHSTGQLHKGDAGHGLFVQLVGRGKEDVAIPEIDGNRPASSFGELLAAQACGDLLALEEAGRRVIRIDLGTNVRTALNKLARAI